MLGDRGTYGREQLAQGCSLDSAEAAVRIRDR